MKKRLSALLVVGAMFSVTNAFAANPFADVPTNSWAYEAVSKLASEGIVVGYPDGYFKGQREITRYEMAQIIARAMAYQGKTNAEQQATVGKLSQEFATELRNLGVRAMKVNEKAGNVAKIGDARIRFIQTPIVTDVKPATIGELVPKVGPDVGVKLQNAKVQSEFANVLKGMAVDVQKQIATESNPQKKAFLTAYLQEIGKGAHGKLVKGFERKHSTVSQYDLRMRLNFIALNSPSTKVIGRIVMDTNLNNQSSDNKVKLDRLFMYHKLGKVDLIVGRQEVLVGDGLVYDDSFDGVLASYKKGDTRVSLAYGNPKHFTGYNGGMEDPVSMGAVLDGADKTLGATLAQVQTKVAKNTELKAFYLWGNQHVPVNAVGMALQSKLDNKLSFGGEYVKLLKADRLPQPFGFLSTLIDDHYSWTAFVGYGNYDKTKAHTWGVKLRYLWEGRVSPVMNNNALHQPFLTNYNAWNLNADYTLAKNMTLNASAFFHGRNQAKTEKYDNMYQVALNYAF